MCTARMTESFLYKNKMWQICKNSHAPFLTNRKHTQRKENYKCDYIKLSTSVSLSILQWYDMTCWKNSRAVGTPNVRKSFQEFQTQSFWVRLDKCRDFLDRFGWIQCTFSLPVFLLDNQLSCWVKHWILFRRSRMAGSPKSVFGQDFHGKISTRHW